MKNRQRNRLDATESSKNLSELCALITLWAVAKCPFFSRLIDPTSGNRSFQAQAAKTGKARFKRLQHCLLLRLCL